MKLAGSCHFKRSDATMPFCVLPPMSCHGLHVLLYSSKPHPCLFHVARKQLLVHVNLQQIFSRHRHQQGGSQFPRMPEGQQILSGGIKATPFWTRLHLIEMPEICQVLYQAKEPQQMSYVSLQTDVAIRLAAGKQQHL